LKRFCKNLMLPVCSCHNVAVNWIRYNMTSPWRHACARRTEPGSWHCLGNSVPLRKVTGLCSTNEIQKNSSNSNYWQSEFTMYVYLTKN